MRFSLPGEGRSAPCSTARHKATWHACLARGTFQDNLSDSRHLECTPCGQETESRSPLLRKYPLLSFTIWKCDGSEERILWKKLQRNVHVFVE
jgi:hypothetical protein